MAVQIHVRRPQPRKVGGQRRQHSPGKILKADLFIGRTSGNPHSVVVPSPYASRPVTWDCRDPAGRTDPAGDTVTHGMDAAAGRATRCGLRGGRVPGDNEGMGRDSGLVAARSWTGRLLGASAVAASWSWWRPADGPGVFV